MTFMQRLTIGAMYVAFGLMLAFAFADFVMPAHWAMRRWGEHQAPAGAHRHRVYRQDFERELTGRVVHLADGDTLTILVNHEQHRIRLWAIDAPESTQAFGQRAKQDLSEKVFGKTVTIEVKDRDQYGRLVGLIMLDGRNINLEMVRDGLAWWYRHFAPRATEFGQAEEAARAAGRGLWADPMSEPPWEYRREERLERSEGRLERSAVD